MDDKTAQNFWQSLFLSEAASRCVDGVRRDEPYLQWRTGLWQVLRCELAWPNDLPDGPNICFPSHALTSENERDALLRCCHLLCWPYALHSFHYFPPRMAFFKFRSVFLSRCSASAWWVFYSVETGRAAITTMWSLWVIILWQKGQWSRRWRVPFEGCWVKYFRRQKKEQEEFRLAWCKKP